MLNAGDWLCISVGAGISFGGLTWSGFGAPPFPNADNAFAVAATFAAIPIPAPIVFAVTNFAAIPTDAPAVGIANAAPCAVIAIFEDCVSIIDLATFTADSPIIAAACNPLFFPANWLSKLKPADILLRFWVCSFFLKLTNSC